MNVSQLLLIKDERAKRSQTRRLYVYSQKSKKTFPHISGKFDLGDHGHQTCPSAIALQSLISQVVESCRGSLSSPFGARFSRIYHSCEDFTSDCVISPKYFRTFFPPSIRTSSAQAELGSVKDIFHARRFGEIICLTFPISSGARSRLSRIDNSIT